MKKFVLSLFALATLSVSAAQSNSTILKTTIKKCDHEITFNHVALKLQDGETTSFSFDDKTLKIVIHPSIKSYFYIDTLTGAIVDPVDDSMENIARIDSSKFFGFTIFIIENGTETLLCNPLVFGTSTIITVPYQDCVLEFEFNEVKFTHKSTI